MVALIGNGLNAGFPRHNVEAFWVLARNYLYLETHDLFEKIRELFEEIEMTPTDVAENLMPKTSPAVTEGRLTSLIEVLEKMKK
ncbi:hypothetical protein LXL04_010310 [Taraxacum kok-saghyz]